jgi:hypothetical protein
MAKDRGTTDIQLRSDTAKWTLHKVCQLKLATLIKITLFWAITQRVVQISYRRFGIT